MREQLNNNPLVQLAVIGALLAMGAFAFVTMSGRGGEEEESAPTVSATVNGVPGAGATPGEAVEDAVRNLEVGAAPTPTAASVPAPPVPPPGAVLRAWESGATVVLLFVRDGAIDDRLVVKALASVRSLPGVSTFVVPAGRIARYAAITQGLAVDRVPALVVISPRSQTDGVPTASVSYGFQSPQSVRQAVVDAGYDGPTRDYHP